MINCGAVRERERARVTEETFGGRVSYVRCLPEATVEVSLCLQHGRRSCGEGQRGAACQA